MSKSAKVREYAAANPSATGPEILAALKKEKVRVSLPLIYQVLSKGKRPKKAKKNGKPQAGISVDALLKAKQVVAEIGSVEEAQRALELLAKLQS